MNHQLLDRKADFFTEHDDTYSTIKHEFSKIFHDNNLHSFANASDIGFLDLGKASTTHGYTGDYDGLGDMDSIATRPYHKEEPASPSPYHNMSMHNSYSPMRFLQSSLNSSMAYNTAGYPNMGGTSRKMSAQSPGFYQSYQPYKYADYSYMDYSTQPNSGTFPQAGYDIYNQPEIVDTHPSNPLSLMWSNEAGKATTTEVIEEEEPIEGSLVALSRRFASVQPEQMTSKKQSSFKVEQDFEKISNKALGIQLDRAAKSTPETVAPRRTTRTSKPLFNKSTYANDEDESGSDDDKDDAFGGDGKSRSSRGLRVLSLKVRDIVSKKKKTSYKEVADALLDDLKQKMKGRPQSEIAKEEQNVKRRVYDALNVLIAADVLRKEGKLVCCGTGGSKFGSSKKGNNDKEGLLEQIQELKKRKKEKLDALQELIFKSLAVRNLVRKNKEKELAEEKTNELNGLKNKKANAIMNGNSQNVNATRIDVVQENASLNQRTQDVIRFPFIVILSSSNENSMNLNMDTSQKQLSIESRKPFDIFGDIDVLLKMRLHYVPREIFNKEIPKDLQKFVSPAFINNLK